MRIFNGFTLLIHVLGCLLWWLQWRINRNQANRLKLLLNTFYGSFGTKSAGPLSLTSIRPNSPPLSTPTSVRSRFPER